MERYKYAEQGMDWHEALMRETRDDLEELVQSEGGSLDGPIRINIPNGETEIVNLGYDEAMDIASKAGEPRIRKEKFGISEVRMAYVLSKFKAYVHTNGTGKGKPDYKLILEEINKKYHGGNAIRGEKWLGAMLSKQRKKAKRDIIRLEEEEDYRLRDVKEEVVPGDTRDALPGEEIYSED